MYIKQVTLVGFKSYKNETVVDKFDPGFNAIVGRNGSGKSNLFAAIEFALTLEYRNLGAAERQNLVYNGRPLYDPAYVEIVFDNSDRKLPVNNDTVTFRRMTSSKKDSFLCNGKKLPNAKQFLYTAGFTNPFFVVKQGKVQELAEGSDANRLKLLETAAGSVDYDKRIAECIKFINTADKKQADARDLLKTFEERRKSLENEASELKEYLMADKKRRAIEHVLNEQERDSTAIAIEKIQEEKKKIIEEREPIQEKHQEINKQKCKLNEQLSEIQLFIERSNAEKDALNLEIPGLVAELERLKNMKEDYQKQLSEGITVRVPSERMKQMKKEIRVAEKQLEKVKETLQNVKNSDDILDKKIIETEAELKALEGRLEGSKEFSNSKDRKAWISNVTAEISKRNKVLEASKSKLRDFSTQKESFHKDIENAKAELISVRTGLATLNKQSSFPDIELFNNKKSKSDMWRNLNNVDEKLVREKSVRANVMEQLRKKVGNPTINGWEGVLSVVSDLANAGDLEVEEGYFGLVIENISCQEGLELAIESAAGNKLFHHIVKNHAIGLRILKEFNRRKYKGAPSFIPLDRIFMPEKIRIPQNDEICKPILSVLEYSEDVTKAVEYIFVNTLLCREMSDASDMARRYKVDCVTTEGDKVFRKGPMTGGWQGTDLTKIELIRGKAKSDSALETFATEKSTIESELKTLEELIVEATKKQESRESKKCALATQKEILDFDVKMLQDKLKNANSAILNLEKDVEKLQLEVHESTCRKEKFEVEMKQPLHKANSQADRETVIKLRKSLKKVMGEKKASFSDRSEKEKNVTSLSQNISHLKSLLEEERFKIIDTHSSQEQEQRLLSTNEMIQSVSEQIKSKQQEFKAIASLISQKSSLTRKLKTQLDTVQIEEADVTSVLYTMEKALHKQLELLGGNYKKMQEINDAAANLGPVPSNIQDFNTKKSKTLCQILSKLAKYMKTVDGNGVNQRAAEQYKEISDQCDKYTAELNTWENGKKELESLIRNLGAKKGEAILKTFSVLQEQFKLIFSQIVPRGTAELILYGKNFNINSCDSQDSDDLRQLIETDGVQGVTVNVNFVSKTVHERQQLLSLSGGQKTVVALCLILAIQKCDPVPFYLFDEVDQALDPQYRTQVAKVISEMATKFNRQFICTTFRKEFLKEADNIFGVAYNNRCSSVQNIRSQDALNFVENDSGSSNENESPGNSEESDINNQFTLNNSIPLSRNVTTSLDSIHINSAAPSQSQSQQISPADSEESNISISMGKRRRIVPDEDENVE